MRRLLHIMICLSVLFLTTCDVHEWPETSEYVKCHLLLNYNTEMTEWKHCYEEDKVVEQGYGKQYDNQQEFGIIRYIIRIYPVWEKMHTSSDYTQEFIYFKDIADGYNHKITLDLKSGNYNIMVWSDLIQEKEDEYFYNADYFGEIMLQGEHQGNNNHRDAFYGTCNCVVGSDMGKNHSNTINITMKRPFAKYEIVANDLSDFIESKKVNINQCKVKIQYVGFMPDAYSLFSNKPIDSSIGITYDSFLTELSDDKASMGFDYVFVGENKSAVTVRIGIYDNDGQQISMTDMLEVPLKTNYHTIITGNFFKQNASGGIDINPDYDGNHNIILH